MAAWVLSAPPQLRSESGPYPQGAALHAPGHVEHEYWFGTAQKVPNRGSVNPPEFGQYQLVASL